MLFFGKTRNGRITLRETLWMHDNARPHTSRASLDLFKQKHVTMVAQSPYSPDLNGCDRWLFKLIKKSVKNVTFANPQEVSEFCRQTFKDIPVERLQQEYEKFFLHVDTVLTFAGDYTVV